MTAKDLLKGSLGFARGVTTGLLGDLSDADLLVRPVPGANHIAWQLGHLIISEHQLVGMVKPGAMPALPEGFADRYKKEMSTSDSPGDFHAKEKYLALYQEQRDGTLRVLDSLSDGDLGQPTPERIQRLAPNVGMLFNLVAQHEIMHSGQYTAVRRKLGKPHVM